MRREQALRTRTTQERVRRARNGPPGAEAFGDLTFLDKEVDALLAESVLAQLPPRQS